MKWLRESLFRWCGGALAAGTLTVAFVVAPAQAQVDLKLLANVNVTSTANSANPEFIGSNPSAVAWDGSSLWLGGYNAAGVTANTAIVKVSNALSSPTFGTAFGVLSTPNSRGFTGLAVQTSSIGGVPTQVLAGAVDTGAGSGDSVREFNAQTGALRWRIGNAGAGNDTTRRGNGVAFDPGFNGAGTNQGVSYLSIGSGRRHLLNTDTGVYINGQNAGAIINVTPTSTVWRDLDFDPSTGDIYARESNRVVKGVRNGNNTFVGGGTTVIGSLPTSGTVDNEHIAFVGTPSLKFLIANNRNVNGSGQVFTSIITALGLDGTALTINYNGFTAPNGNGAYDFSYNAASQTLAISDFSNRHVYIFGVNQLVPAPEPGTFALIGLGVLGLLRIRRAPKG